MARAVYSEPYGVPMKYSGFEDKQEEEESTENIWGIDPVTLGYCVCGFVIAEGTLLLLALSKVMTVSFVSAATAKTNPMRTWESVALYTAGWGDIIFGILALMTMWCCRNVMSGIWTKYARNFAQIPIFTVGALLAFRILVTLGIAPFVGILLAFQPPQAEPFETYFYAFLYLSFNIFLVYILAFSFRLAVSEGHALQLIAKGEEVEERMALLTNAANVRTWGHPTCGESIRKLEVEPMPFGFLPLVETIIAYAILIAMACVICLMEMGFWGGTIGGWAFFIRGSKDDEQRYLEIFIYIGSLVAASIGLLGASALLDKTAKPPLTALFVFLIGSVARFCLLIPVTGMTLLVELDICHLHVRWLQHGSSAFPIHCTGGDFTNILFVSLAAGLDAYLIWGVFQLWYHTRRKSMPHAESAEDDGSA